MRSQTIKKQKKNNNNNNVIYVQKGKIILFYSLFTSTSFLTLTDISAEKFANTLFTNFFGQVKIDQI